ncbi:hypothetical protein DES53_101644 [Roseimicrobium gellanilyticum]|uniref:Uncharacterized protein n=1 Tax=Roseimicrobium gellanilyticum TaxID=748857 RepID=A0A366HW87_9BACT|nr:hypothetical protein DES53_101644 [Roseimicrobium gellanilyticum]
MKTLKLTLRIVELVVMILAAIFLFLMLCTPLGNKLG